MSALERMLKQAQETKGMWHKGTIRDIRQYIELSKTDDIRKAIKEIKDQSLLRLLWEVGLNSILQATLLEHSRRLAAEQGGAT